jgi:hypothetical protein
MISQLIRLRLLQLYRGSGELGLFRVMLLLVVILPLIILFVVQRISVHPWQFIIPASALGVVLMIHIRRKDFRFMQSIVPQPGRLYMAEYLVFSLPMSLVFITEARYFHLLGFLTVVVLIAFIPPPKAVAVERASGLSAIPRGMFEWQSGIRKSRIVLALFYLPGLFGFYQVWLAAVSLFMITMIVVSFYSEYEPRNMLVAGDGTAAGFLSHKIARHAGLFAACMLPQLLAVLIHPEILLVALGYFLASVNLVIFSILLKYYQYRPAAFSGAHQMVTSLACLISLILPAAAIILVVNLFLWAGALRNLKYYLHA